MRQSKMEVFVKQLLTLLALAAGLLLSNAVLAVKDSINIVGSSTVFQFSKVVAERYGKSTKFKTPTVESTGTGGGFKEFCQGIAIDTPDISNASRRIKPSELTRCNANGVTEIIEVPIGYDGIVLANASKAQQFNISRKTLFLALAKKFQTRTVVKG